MAALADLGDLTLREHLNEVRRRLMIIAAVVVVATAGAFVVRDDIMAFLLAPGFKEAEFRPIFTETLEMVGVTFKVILMAGFILALPVLLHQIIRFVSPGLTRSERLYVYLFLPGTLVTFAGGVAFGYYVLFPPAFHFLFTFGNENVDPAIRVSSYINVLTSLMFWMGAVFQLPVVMFSLGRLGVVTAQQMAWFRRYAVILAFVAGAFITPTFDPINQSMVAFPIIVLYEVGILLARLGGRIHNASSRPARPNAIVRLRTAVSGWLLARFATLHRLALRTLVAPPRRLWAAIVRLAKRIARQ